MLHENVIEVIDETCSGYAPGWVDWHEVDCNLRRIARQRAALDAEEARWLRAAVHGEVWRELGVASLHEYLERRLGYTPRAAGDRVRVALALAELPALSEALESSELPFTAIRELARVATPTTEVAWLEHARDRTVREIEEAVSGHVRGELPTDPPRPDIRMRVLRYEVRPETFAKLRQAQQILEGERGMRLDDDALVAALCNAVLGAGHDRAQHQIMTIECERCRQGWQEGAGARFAIGKAALERANCDAQRIDPKSHRATQEIPPRTRRFVFRRDGGKCCIPGCRAARHIEIHHLRPRGNAGSHEPDNLTLLCDGHHRALHDGLLSITGKAPELEFRWMRPAHVGRDAEAALVKLGYKRGAAREAVDRAIARLDVDASTEQVIRDALEQGTT